MSGWPLVTLYDIFDIARGGSPRPIDDFVTDDASGINWIMISDASEGTKYISATKKRIRPEGANRSRTVKSGDFLLTNSMSFGKPYIMRTSGCIHDGWLVLSPRRNDVDADFIYHLLGSKAVYSEFERRAAGVTVKNLNIELVKGVEIPFPPLPEQRRLADILDKADALRAKRRAAIAQLNTLTQAIFIEMFGDPATNPKGWAKIDLGELIDSGPQNGVYKPSTDYGSGTPILRIDAFYDGVVTKLANLKRVRLSKADCERYMLREGEIVINRVNSREYLGKSALIPRLNEITVFESNMMRFNIRRNVIVPGYLIHFLQTAFVRGQILGAAKDAVNQSSINQQDVKAIQINVPPFALQNDFVERVDVLGRIETLHRRARESTDILFASLQHRAFRGEL